MTRDDINKIIFDNELFHGTVGIGVVMDINQLEKFASLVSAKEREKWEPVISAVIREIPYQLRSSKKGNAPGHAHEIVGIWDSDNGKLAGTVCAWCKAWNTAKDIIAEKEQT